MFHQRCDSQCNRGNSLGGRPKERIWRSVETCIKACVKYTPTVTRADLNWTFEYPGQDNLYPSGIVYSFTFDSACWNETHWLFEDHVPSSQRTKRVCACQHVLDYPTMTLLNYFNRTLLGSTTPTQHSEVDVDGGTNGTIWVPNPCDAPCGPGTNIAC